jgi:hypothetical protein
LRCACPILRGDDDEQEDQKQLMRAVRVLLLATVVFASVLTACLQLDITAQPFYESAAFYGLAGGALFCTLRGRGWWWAGLSFGTTCALFALRLVAMWRMDKVNPHLVGGLLPYSDASSYYTEALRLLEFGQFSWATVNAGRPLWPGTVATLLSITGGDLQIAVALLTAIVACACYCFARETQLSFGTSAATVVLLALYLFYTQFIGVTSSEALGLALGALGAGVLLRAVRENSRVLFWSGLFLSGLALQARPGAFFILPALMLWGTWSFGTARRFRAQFMAGCAAAVIAGFAVQALFMTFLVDATAPPAFTKIGLMVWSLAVGRSPDDIYLVHPEASGMLPQQLNPLILGWAWDALWANPLSVIRDAVRVTVAFFYVEARFIDYVHAPPAVISAILKLNVLGWIGLAVRSRTSRYGMVGAGIVGIVASVPLTFYVGSRSNAATMPLMVLPAALAVSWIIASARPFRLIKLTAALNRRRRLLALPAGMTLLNLGVLAWCFEGWAALYAPLVIIGAIGLVEWATVRSKAASSRRIHARKPSPQSSLIYGLTLASVVIIGPLGIKGAHQAASLPDLGCPTGEVAAYVRVNPGSVVNVVEDGRLAQTRAPNVRNGDYGKPWGGTTNNLPPSFERDLLNIKAEHTLLQAVDLKTGGASGILWLNVPTALLPRDPGIVRLCSPPTAYGMYAPSSAEMVSQVR